MGRGGAGRGRKHEPMAGRGRAREREGAENRLGEQARGENAPRADDGKVVLDALVVDVVCSMGKGGGGGWRVSQRG